MSETIPPVVTPPVVTPPVVTPPAATWYQDKVAAEHVGVWQNKYPTIDINDPAAVASAVTKSYVEAQKHFGAPPEELVRFPKNPADPAYDAIRQRLGTPAAAADYDMTAVKFTDGSTLEPTAEQAFRDAAFAAGVPKDRIGGFLAPILKFMENADTAANADATAKVVAEKALLATNWGNNHPLNLHMAQQGAAALGLTAEDIAGLESVVGYAKVMEAMRRVGASGMEDSTPSGGVGGSTGKVVTLEQATARKAELMNDTEWRNRYLKGDANSREFKDMTALNTIIATAAQGR